MPQWDAGSVGQCRFSMPLSHKLQEAGGNVEFVRGQIWNRETVQSWSGVMKRQMRPSQAARGQNAAAWKKGVQILVDLLCQEQLTNRSTASVTGRARPLLRHMYTMSYQKMEKVNMETARQKLTGGTQETGNKF